MSNIRNIWMEASSQQNENNIPRAILEKQAEAITADVERTEIIASVITVANSTEPFIKHILFLFPRFGDNYNYRFLEFKQPIDSYYPVSIEAFQRGDTSFGECNSENEIYEKLSEIFRDTRRAIVFEQLKNIAHTVRTWRQERDRE
jgi:hypothetical protein